MVGWNGAYQPHSGFGVCGPGCWTGAVVKNNGRYKLTSTRLDRVIFKSTPAGCGEVTIKYDGEKLSPGDYSVDYENGIVTFSTETTVPALPASVGWSQQRGKRRERAQWKRELRGRI